MEEDPDPKVPRCKRSPPKKCELLHWQKKLSLLALAALVLAGLARTAERMGVLPPPGGRLRLSAAEADKVGRLLGIIDDELMDMEREERRARRIALQEKLGGLKARG